MAYYRNITLIHSGSEGRAQTENGEKSGNVRPQNDVTHTERKKKENIGKWSIRLKQE